MLIRNIISTEPLSKFVWGVEIFVKMRPEKCKLTLACFLSSLQIDMYIPEFTAKGRESCDSFIESMGELSDAAADDLQNHLDVGSFVNSQVVFSLLAGCYGVAPVTKGELGWQHLCRLDHVSDPLDMPRHYAVVNAVIG